MAFDATSSYRQVLSPPVLASVESQHTFGYAGSSLSRTSTEPQEHQNTPTHPATSSSNTKRRRSRASSAAAAAAAPDLDFVPVSSSNSGRRHRRLGSAGGITANTPLSGSTRSRSGSNSGGQPSLSIASRTTSQECDTLLGQRMRNRSTPQLNGLSSLSTSQSLGSGRPLDSSSVPNTPHLHSLPTASGYFDPLYIAQSQNYMLQATLQDREPALSAVLPRSSPSAQSDDSGTAGPANQSEWAQHAAHIQQAAHLLGLHRLFASRSTPHLPDLDQGFVGHEFESPPPYAPQASANETELGRAFAGRSPPTTSSTPAEPPLPPPISIPGLASEASRAHYQPASSSIRRPSSRPGPSPRGSRSGPPSPTTSFYGRRGLTSLSPLPVGLEMTPSVVYTPQFSAPSSPNIAPDSDREDGRDETLSFSSSRSRQWRDERRKSVGSNDAGRLGNSMIATADSGSLVATPAQAASSASSRRRLRSDSASHVQPQTRSAVTARDGVEHSRPSVPQNVSCSDQTLEPASSLDSNPASDEARSARTRVGLFEEAEQHSTLSESPSSPDLGGNESEPASPASADTTATPTDFTPRVQDAIREDLQTELNSDHEDESDEFPLVLKMILHSLRVLAAVPGCIGTFWLVRNALMLARLQPSLLSAGQTLITANGTTLHPNESGLHELGGFQGALKLGKRQPGALDFAVSCLWSMSTAYHALSFTTLLLRRWLLYYSILPSLIRLVALQAICWPLVRLTVFLFGSDQPLGAWVVIGTTTALSDVISRWVTSNIADAPLEGELEDDEDDWDDEAMNNLSDLPFGMYGRTRVGTGPSARYLYGNRRDYGMSRISGESDWDPRSGDESEAMAAVHQSMQQRWERRRQRRGGQGTRFWRAVIGGPTTPSKRRKRKYERADGQKSYLSGTATETEIEAESDWAGYGTDRTFMGASHLRYRRSGTMTATDDEDERRVKNNDHTKRTTPGLSRVDADETRQPRTILPRSSSFSSSAGRADSRRKFRWDVAMRRNVLPVAALGYLSMWILILDAMKLGA